MHLGTVPLRQCHHKRNAKHLHRKYEEKVQRTHERQLVGPLQPRRKATFGVLRLRTTWWSFKFSHSLLVQASIANIDVRRVLIDTGASCNIMYTGLFKNLQLAEKKLSPYVGNKLHGFNGLSTQPWGYVELPVTFREKESKKTIKILFLAIECPSLYNCIIGRAGLAQLGAACSTAHLKLKYHAKDGIIASLNGDIEAAKRCFLQANKSQNSVSQSSKTVKDKGKTDASTLDANLVELDPRFTKEDLKE